MSKFLLVIAVVLSVLKWNVGGIPIYTPDIPEECNNFMINGPGGWGYRTFAAQNGLIAVFWPETKNFNETDTAVFVFLQDNNKLIPDEPENINLFTEKCTKANFHFSFANDDPTKSLAEQYFSGRCGRTMIILKEQFKDYHLIIALVSAGYITRKQLREVKGIAKSYREEIEKYIKNQPMFQEYDEDNDEADEDGDSDDNDDGDEE